MSNFILQYAKGTAPVTDLEKIQSTDDVRVLDSMPGMVLVQATTKSITRLISGLGNSWSWSPERTYGLPSPRPRIASRNNNHQA